MEPERSNSVRGLDVSATHSKTFDTSSTNANKTSTVQAKKGIKLYSHKNKSQAELESSKKENQAYIKELWMSKYSEGP